MALLLEAIAVLTLRQAVMWKPSMAPCKRSECVPDLRAGVSFGTNLPPSALQHFCQLSEALLSGPNIGEAR